MRFEKSAPAQNERPSAANTIALHCESASSRSKASPISAISSLSKKLCGGRRISTVATKPSRLTPISLIRISSKFPFDDQRVDHREALSLRVDDDRIEVDFLDQIGMSGGKTRQGLDQFGQGVAVGERRP